MRIFVRLAIKWTLSREQDTLDQNICTLVDPVTNKKYRAMGGGYDLVGTVFSEWLMDVHGAELSTIAAGKAYTQRVIVEDQSYPELTNRDGLHGMTANYNPDGTLRDVCLDGAEGMERMERIAEAIGLTVKQIREQDTGNTIALVVVTANVGDGDFASRDGVMAAVTVHSLVIDGDIMVRQVYTSETEAYQRLRSFAAEYSLSDNLDAVSDEDLLQLVADRYVVYLDQHVISVPVVESESEGGLVHRLNAAQAEVVEHYQAYNVPASWFIGETKPDGYVEVIAIGDAAGGVDAFVWSFRISPDGGEHHSQEARITEDGFSTGIEV